MNGLTAPMAKRERKIHHREPAGRTRCGMGGDKAIREIDWKQVTCCSCIRIERAACSLDADRVTAQKLDDLLLAEANSWYSSVQLEGIPA